MSTTVSSVPRAAASLPSARFEAFAIVFGLTFTIIYTLCDQMNWPLFTYHPAVRRFDFGYGPATSGEGPAVYWYGWVAMASVTASVLGLAATILPEERLRKIPSALIWAVPIFALFVLGWSLSLFYR